jgi:uncharacterized protein YjiS (DUF1127 family)
VLQPTLISDDLKHPCLGGNPELSAAATNETRIRRRDIESIYRPTRFVPSMRRDGCRNGDRITGLHVCLGRSGRRAAASPSASSIVSRAVEAVLSRRSRMRARAELAGLDDRMLRDIGLTRADVCEQRVQRGLFRSHGGVTPFRPPGVTTLR